MHIFAKKKFTVCCVASACNQHYSRPVYAWKFSKKMEIILPDLRVWFRSVTVGMQTAIK